MESLSCLCNNNQKKFISIRLLYAFYFILILIKFIDLNYNKICIN